MADNHDPHRREQVNQIKREIETNGRESAGKGHNQYSPEWKQANAELGRQRRAARERYLEQVRQAQKSEERARARQQQSSTTADPRKEEARRQAAQMTKQVKAREASQTAAQGQGM